MLTYIRSCPYCPGKAGRYRVPAEVVRSAGQAANVMIRDRMTCLSVQHNCSSSAQCSA